MTKHERLKEICDEIGYILNTSKYIKVELYDEDSELYPMPYYEEFEISKDVKEIIFTTEFMNKLTMYYMDNIYKGGKGILVMRPILADNIIRNLDDPTLYLYNLLQSGTSNKNTKSS